MRRREGGGGGSRGAHRVTARRENMVVVGDEETAAAGRWPLEELEYLCGGSSSFIASASFCALAAAQRRLLVESRSAQTEVLKVDTAQVRSLIRGREGLH